MTTVTQLRSRVGRMLTDPDFDGYDADLFYDGLAVALDAILPWVPKVSVETITGDGSTSYTLPDDCYQVEAILSDNTGELLPRAVLVPGYSIGDNIEAENDWLEYPHGSISFSKALASGETYTLYYLAYWTKPTANDLEDDIEPPESTVLGLVLYTTAYMLTPSAISASEVRQFNTKVDSGHPEHNPMQVTTKFLLRLFAEEMNRHPKYQKAQK